MKSLTKLERLKKIHNLIKIAQTGSPVEFASKLGIKKSQLYCILDDLKLKGFPIKYSRILKSYVYSTDCDLEIEYSIKLVTDKKIIKIEKSKK